MRTVSRTHHGCSGIVVKHTLHDSQVPKPAVHQRPVLIAIVHKPQTILDNVRCRLDGVGGVRPLRERKAMVALAVNAEKSMKMGKQIA